ncbi:MAG TPA: thioredoxin domain-containing protein [Flavobacteriales bacterium]|nr:thioredoxin domain-containing protein [Flavobacteriales bacterium]HQW32089.1 thioredoxin domain-containing protein [Flavobacteriales bacterium]HQY02744.1 thioredoxin domain-containing protein [Flavobacteriales bacterium]HQY80372.1 thioredoxin domain-containing protein [Flavobacteriales bacterium]HRA16032.1 thioredoxin domain-containing protein [Flavobacteriales bacterium]
MRILIRASRALPFYLYLLPGCGTGQSPVKDTMHAHTNRLIHETSPYLLQHAHNPVDWFPWGDEAFAKAKAENKPVLVSIGYSSCHWCHVMEHESFEDESVAKLMNDRFVCIKVDREERPDIDQVYMAAVQLMTGKGGWPLNCFTLPDGRPMYGGTYFPKEQWAQVLDQLADTWKSDPEKVKEYAEKLHAGVQQSELVALNTAPPDFTRKDAEDLAAGFAQHFDTTWGGPDRAPKFPLPNNYEFLLRYAITTGDKAITKQVRLTLDKMTEGGIFDQAGGGFARYSTDERWKAPHFEKMLYDNAQLISLYSHAYQAFHEEAYRDIVERTIAWAEREMRSPDGAFYSALDADSEGEEGRYYVWTKEELATALGDDTDFATDYYNVGGDGLWEHGRNILLRNESDAEFADRKGMTFGELRATVERVNSKLLAAREKRVHPGLDDKALTSWNAMMVTGLCDAYNAFGDSAHLQQAEQTMRLLLKQCRREDGGLWHSFTKGKASINGYLEDYSFTIEALTTLYQTTFDETWLKEAHTLAEYAIAHFHDGTSGMFWFTSNIDPPLITRRMEVNDNVIPASNSSMAKALFTLGHLYDDQRMLATSKQQLNNVLDAMASYPGGYSNWALLLMEHVYPWYEIAITGPEALARRREFAAHYISGRVFLGGTGKSDLPLLEDKFMGDATTIFVCENKVCQLPVTTVEQALEQVR